MGKKAASPLRWGMIVHAHLKLPRPPFRKRRCGKLSDARAILSECEVRAHEVLIWLSSLFEMLGVEALKAHALSYFVGVGKRVQLSI